VTELPSGTVTFLFTDIEGSTRLVKEHRDLYGELRAEHDRIMRAAVTTAGGQEVDTQGDAFFVAFRRAGDALTAAVAAQRALAEHPWPDGAAVRVRMGIHTGEPAVGSERYVGIGVHRAARICSAAHGGQVLLSSTTRDLVQDDLPSDVSTRDIGEHTLKDIDRPERLFQLVVDGLPSDFPPPRGDVGEAAALARGRERALAKAASAAVGVTAGWSPGKRLGAGIAAVVGVAAVVVGIVLATRGGTAHATAIAANAVGLIDAHGNRIRDQVNVDAAPTSVAYGARAVWVTNAYAGTVSRVDPDSRAVVQTITVGNSPAGIAVGDGGVWVANHDDGTVSWINPESNTEVKRIPVGNGPTAVALGSGSVWVTNSDDRTVSRIDAATGDVVHTIATNAVGRGIVVGAGSVWVTDEATRTLVQIDPATNQVTNTASVGSGPAGVAYGGGALWVANELDGTVSEIDPTTLTVRRAIPVAGSPSAIAFGDGGLWVSAKFGQRVVRIDPRTGSEKAVVRVGNRPEGLATVPGGVWVAVQASGRGRRGGRLLVLGGGFDSIDPGVAGDTNSGSLIGLAYDGLAGFRRVGGSEGTQLVPDLASGLPFPTHGGKSYTFRLRPGIRYSDGSLVRPVDFRRGLERMFELGSIYVHASPGTKVLGASHCARGRPCNLAQGVVVEGRGLVTFRFTDADPTTLGWVGGIIPVPRGTPPQDVGTNAIPSTGPYAIESYVPGKEVTLVRNRFFRSWSQAARPNGYPDEIVWRIEVPPDEAVREVIDGKADVLFTTVPNDRVQELATRYPRQLHVIPQRATAFVFLNTRVAPFNDIRVRRALNYAVDRQKMADLHGGSGVAQPTCQLVPPSVPGYRRYCPYTVGPDPSGVWKAPDLAKAHQLVASSGTRGEKIVVWTFDFFGKEGHYLVRLLRSLGYRATLKELPFDTYFRALTPRVQAGFAGWFGIGVAADMFSNLNCDYSANWARFCDARVDKQVRRLADEEARDRTAGAVLAAQIDRELVNRAPWVPLFTPRFADFVSKRVGNYQANTYASASVLLDQLWVR
jgi:peptide/nickel transport system substrate-binding protein